MSEQFQMTRRSMLAGAAIAGAVTPLIGAVSAHAEEAVAKTAHINVASLPRVKVDLVKPPSSTPIRRRRKVAPRSSSSR